MWLTGGPLPSDKTDIAHIDVAAEKVDVNGQIEDILYVGYLKCGGNGTWNTVLYLDDGDGKAPSEGDTHGDFLLVFEFSPSSGGVTFRLYELTAGEWMEIKGTDIPADAIDGAAAGNYGEVSINLTALGILPENSCRTASIAGQGASVPGLSLTSAVKDLVDMTPFEISNCGALDVMKKTTPAGITSAVPFHYVVAQTDEHDVHDDTLAVDLNGSGSTDEPSAPSTELDADITAGGTHNWTSVISQPDYFIAETTPTAPWVLKTITCTYSDIFAAGTPTTTVTMYENGQPTDATFIVPPSVLGTKHLGPAECTITNATTVLVLNKVIENDSDGTADGTEFVLSALSTSTSVEGPDMAPNDPAAGVGGPVAPGTFTLSESGPDGYESAGWTCVVTDAAGKVTETTGATVTVPEMGSANCTVTNKDKASLRWTKVDSLTDDLLDGTSWKLTPPEGDPIMVDDCDADTAAGCTGADKDPAAGEFLVIGLDQGAYTLEEVGTPNGYQTNTTVYTVTIDSDGKFWIGDEGVIENVPTAVTWMKKDDAGAMLGGATFEMCFQADEGEDCTVVEDNTGQEGYEGWDSDERPGYFLVNWLWQGNYSLVEVEAPAGYIFDDQAEPRLFTVTGEAKTFDVGVFVNEKIVYGLTLTKTGYEAAGEGLEETDGTVAFGDTVSYALEVTATGNVAQTNVTVTDVLPVGTTYIEGSATCLFEVSPCTATYDAATRTVTMVVAEMGATTSVVLAFDVTVDAAPTVAPGTTYTWQGDNVGAAMSTEVTTKVPSNVVTIRATKTELPETGSNTVPIVLIGLLAILLGGGLIVLARRREKHTTR